MNNICQLLKGHIDEMYSQHKVTMKDIAKVLGMNVSSLRSGIYNDQLGFEKLVKIAVISGFPLMRYITSLVERYPKDVKDKEDAAKRVLAYADALKGKELVPIIATESYKEDFDNNLKESNKDTATVVMLAKMRDCVAKDAPKQEGKEDICQELVQTFHNIEPKEEPEVVIKQIDKDSVIIDPTKEEETEMTTQNNVSEPKEEAVEIQDPGKFTIEDVTRYMIENVKGMEAVGLYSVITSLWAFASRDDVEELLQAYTALGMLMKEVTEHR